MERKTLRQRGSGRGVATCVDGGGHGRRWLGRMDLTGEGGARRRGREEERAVSSCGRAREPGGRVR